MLLYSKTTLSCNVVGAMFILLTLIVAGAELSNGNPLSDNEIVQRAKQLRENETLLLLDVGSFDPVKESIDVPGALQSKRTSVEYQIVQFDHAPTEQDVDRLRTAGWEILEAIPNNAYGVRRARSDAKMLSGLPAIRYAGPYRGEYKLSRRIVEQVQRNMGGELDVVVTLWPGGDAKKTAVALAKTGAVDLKIPKAAYYPRIVCKMSSVEISAALNLDFIRRIEPFVALKRRNDSATGILQSGVEGTRSIWNHGLHGENQIIGHIDGQIHMDSCYFRDDINNTPGPLHRKVVSNYNSRAADDHGTHTAGTALGLNVSGDTLHAGHAYNAKITHTADLDVLGGVTEESNLDEVLLRAQGDGAYIHTNSWGADNTSDYVYWCVDIDRYSWENENALVLFAATNYNELTHVPENAKNCLGVGNANHAPNHLDRTPFGCGFAPTSDGRLKPEIYAPGTNTISASYSSPCGTLSMTGTSMATPALAGSTALIRQYFTEGYYPTGNASVSNSLTPSGPLMKAMILNSTVDMNPAGYPSDLEGWGLPKLDNALYFQGETRRLWIHDERRTDGLGIAQGEIDAYGITVIDPTEPLKVTLVWHDPAGTLNSTMPVVNDLDLQVIEPDLTTYYTGNHFSGGQSVTGGTPDNLNNVEMVLRNNPVTGYYVVRVVGSTVNPAYGQQGYAIVVTGGLAHSPQGALSLDNAIYGCGSVINLSVVDGNVAGNTVLATLTSPSGDTETVTLTGSAADGFDGSIMVLESAVAPGNGLLEAASGQTLTATYYDASTGGDPPAANVIETATLDCQPPIISNLNLQNILDVSASVFFDADEPVTGYVNVGAACGETLYTFPIYNTSGSTYTANLTGLNPLTNYYLYINVTDVVMNNVQYSMGLTCCYFVTGKKTTSEFYDFEPDADGFFVVQSQGTGNWIWVESSYTHSPTHSFYCDDFGSIHDVSLVSPSFTVPSSGAELRFWHTYSMEGGYDGGVLEISINSGAWNDLGSAIRSGGYGGELSDEHSNPLGGREAWTGGSLDEMSEVIVDLSAYAGLSVQTRWRFGSDISIAVDGWYVDDVSVVSITGGAVIDCQAHRMRPVTMVQDWFLMQ